MSSLYDPDTIAALITAPGEAGVAIVRISGPDAVHVADRVFRGPAAPSQQAPRTFVYGRVEAEGQVVDEALCLVFHAPHSYTGEHVVELQGHGGSVSAKRVLRAVLAAGARSAEPGEFTRRAFLNGRLDLVQAEAVMDLISAHSERASAAALEQLEGGLSRSFNDAYDRLADIAADLEATLDFPEDELPETVFTEIRTRLIAERSALQQLVDTWEEGHLLRDGVLVVLSGKPNTGKSTLLNGLLGHDRAIVSEVAGTTRDHIEESMVLRGIPVRLVDTAGLRATVDAIEQAGIDRTRQFRARADLHLYLVDGSQPLDEETRGQIEELPVERSVLVWNKTDLPRVADPAPWRDSGLTVVETALGTGSGLDALTETMAGKLLHDVDLSARPHAVIGERHRRLLVDACVELDTGVAYLDHDDPEHHVPAVSQVRLALEHLGAVTGREYQEDMLDRIFSRFCIGK